MLRGMKRYRLSFKRAEAGSSRVATCSSERRWAAGGCQAVLVPLSAKHPCLKGRVRHALQQCMRKAEHGERNLDRSSLGRPDGMPRRLGCAVLTFTWWA